jgi:hypothetical protein
MTLLDAICMRLHGLADLHLSELDQGPSELAVVRFKGVAVYMPLSCVAFLRNETRKTKA